MAESLRIGMYIKVPVPLIYARRAPVWTPFEADS